MKLLLCVLANPNAAATDGSLLMPCLAVIESIYNNRTAMVTYNKQIPSATSTEVELWGTGAGIKANLQTWSHDAANNLGPQP